MLQFLVYAIRTRFGSTGENEFGFIQEPFILIARKNGKRFVDTFIDPRSCIFPDREHYRRFRTRESAQRWCDTHEVTMDGEKLSFRIREYYGRL